MKPINQTNTTSDKDKPNTILGSHNIWMIRDGEGQQLLLQAFDQKEDVVDSDKVLATIVFDDVDQMYTWFMVNATMVQKIYAGIKQKQAGLN